MCDQSAYSSYSSYSYSDFNYSYPDYYSDYGFSSYRQKFFIVPFCFTIIFLTGVIGNSLVLYVILKHGAMKTVTNLFLLNLAVADLVFLIHSVPMSASEYLSPEWLFGDFLCRMRNYLSYVCYYVSVCTLTVMSVDRYYAVVHPMRSRIYRTLQHTVLTIVIIWILCLAGSGYNIHISDEVKVLNYGKCRKFCLEWWTNKGRRRFITCIILIFYCLPLLTVAISYALMARRLLVTVSPQMGSDDAQIRTVRTRRKIARLVLAVVLTFALCWLPFHLFQLISVWVTSYDAIYNESFSIYGQIARVFAFSNSCMNPLLYSFLSDNFRKHFKRTCSPLNSCGRVSRIGGVMAGFDQEAGPTNLTNYNASLRQPMNTISLRVVKNGKLTSGSGSASGSGYNTSPSPTV
ncbi:galanin receptor type 2-like [Glandiceps talaboti]